MELFPKDRTQNIHSPVPGIKMYIYFCFCHQNGWMPHDLVITERHLALWLNTTPWIFPSVKWAWFLPVSLRLCGWRTSRRWHNLAFLEVCHIIHATSHSFVKALSAFSTLSTRMGLKAHLNNCLTKCKMHTAKRARNVSSSGTLPSSFQVGPKL